LTLPTAPSARVRESFSSLLEITNTCAPAAGRELKREDRYVSGSLQQDRIASHQSAFSERDMEGRYARRERRGLDVVQVMRCAQPSLAPRCQLCRVCG
jgi:hypothetical protein